MSAEATNAQLVARCLAGDGEAFGQIVANYRGRVHKVVRQHVFGEDDVEEVVQETFCKAWLQLPTLRSPACLGAWLARIAANAVTQRQRRARVRERLQHMEPGEVLPTYRQGDHSPPNEVLRALLAAVDALPTPYGRVVDLYHFAGQDCRQIGRVLGISHYAVKWRLSEARRRLRGELAELVGWEQFGN